MTHTHPTHDMIASKSSWQNISSPRTPYGSLERAKSTSYSDGASYIRRCKKEEEKVFEQLFKDHIEETDLISETLSRCSIDYNNFE